jgi:hypothetical protein
VETVIKKIFSLLLRAVLVLMGLVFVLSVLAAAALLLALWGLRALWAKLMGRPVEPPVITILRRARWERFYRARNAAQAHDADVIDVAARQVNPGSASPDRLER